jgi:hypothetical protein
MTPRNEGNVIGPRHARSAFFWPSFTRAALFTIVSTICAPNLALAADLTGTGAVSAIVLEQQQRAAKAANGFASALYDDKTPEYIVTFKSALNSASAIPVLPFSVSPPTRGGYVTSVGLFDRDPRYIENVKHLVLDVADGAGRVWGGLPTLGYLNTVVVTGGSGLCSGTVIAKNAVLTAQHCHCDGVNQFVATGSTFDGQHPGIPIAKSTPMKKCDQPVSAEADVALLILRDDLDASVVPATFASSARIDNARSVRLVGFGRDTNGNVGQKLFVDVPMASTSCSGTVKRNDGTAVSDSAYYGCNKGFELVAGAALLNKDTCNGDSGGPAFVRDAAGNDYLAAATSRAVAYPSARPCGDGGVYVRVDGDIIAWVLKQGIHVVAQ